MAKIICGWCTKDMGEKEPLEDKVITHSICRPCSDDLLREIE